MGHDADEPRRQPALRHERRACAAGEGANHAGGVEILGQIEVVRAAGRGPGDRASQVKGERVDDDVVAVDPHRPQAGREDAGDDAHGGALAGAVGPEEADDLAARHLEGDVLDGGVAGRHDGGVVVAVGGVEAVIGLPRVGHAVGVAVGRGLAGGEALEQVGGVLGAPRAGAVGELLEDAQGAGVAREGAGALDDVGVRLAVGATSNDIRQLVLKEGNVLALAGIAGGLLLTAYSAKWVRDFVFDDYDRYDSRVFAVAALTLFLTALLASWVPARRAMRINPVEALKND